MFDPDKRATICFPVSNPNNGKVVRIVRLCHEAQGAEQVKIPECGRSSFLTGGQTMWVIESLGSPLVLQGLLWEELMPIAPIQQRYLRQLPDEDDIRNFDEDIDEPIAPLTPVTT